MRSVMKKRVNLKAPEDPHMGNPFYDSTDQGNAAFEKILPDQMKMQPRTTIEQLCKEGLQQLDEVPQNNTHVMFMKEYFNWQIELVQNIEDIDQLKYYLRTSSISDYIEDLVRCIRFMPKIMEAEPWSHRELSNTTLDQFETVKENKITAEEQVKVNEMQKNDFQWEQQRLYQSPKEKFKKYKVETMPQGYNFGENEHE